MIFRNLRGEPLLIGNHVKEIGGCSGEVVAINEQDNQVIIIRDDNSGHDGNSSWYSGLTVPGRMWYININLIVENVPQKWK